jgi:hypothetical protein
MSGADLDAEAAAGMMCCASCGIAEGDDIKLKKCTACDLVKYCSDECQQDHRPNHEEICKERAAELHEILFQQPESSSVGDCPICFSPLPIDAKKPAMFPCCKKIICKGCDHANNLRQIEERLQQTCPFCRQPPPENMIKRIAANDSVALLEMGEKLYKKGDHHGAFEYFTKAVELGNVDAHYRLVCIKSGKVLRRTRKS